MSRRYAQAQKFTLAVGISTTDTSITLQSFNFPDGTAIASGDLGGINYGTLEPGTSREESISFTGITSNADGTVTLTGVTRGLGFGAVDTYSEQSDLKQQHGTGAIFILSNTAAFYNDFVNKYNDETISGTLSVPIPTSATHAATKQYVDDNVNGGTVSNDRIVQAGDAGESVAAGDLVYFDDTDNEWKKTDANTAATVNNVLLGIAQGAGSDGGAISGGVLTYGLDSTQTGLTAGVKLYASDTAGEIAESAGTTEKVIGWSKSATEIYFDANVDNNLTADEKDALAGGGDFGTPSTSNKYLTQDYASRTEKVTFTASGTWTKDDGLTRVLVRAWGAGGSGACSHSNSGATGGGGGGYSEAWFEASELGATETVTIGAGGAAVSTTADGNVGGNTTFGSLLTAYAGGGGEQGSTEFGGGGGGSMSAGANGNVGTAGSPGEPIASAGGQSSAANPAQLGAGGGGVSSGTTSGAGSAYQGGGGGGAASSSGTTNGGSSVFGGAGGAGQQGATGNATSGSQPGGGGGGKSSNSGSGSSGAGGDGQVEVIEFYT